jgi:hypothetical protein
MKCLTSFLSAILVASEFKWCWNLVDQIWKNTGLIWAAQKVGISYYGIFLNNYIEINLISIYLLFYTIRNYRKPF